MTPLLNYKPLFIEENHAATALHLACISSYGVEYLDWELETLELNILDDLNVQEADMDTGVFDRLHALNVSLTTDLYYNYFECFENITKALNFEEPLFNAVTPCTPAEMVWAIHEVRLNDADDDQFSLEVQAYIRESLHFAGYYQAPKELSFCKYDEYYNTRWVLESSLKPTAELVKQGQQQMVSEYFLLRKTALEEDISFYFADRRAKLPLVSSNHP